MPVQAKLVLALDYAEDSACDLAQLVAHQRRALGL